MSLNTWLRSVTADRVLRPVRRMVGDQVAAGSRVLELGFGTGDLLFQLAPQIRLGVGLERHLPSIRHARRRAAREGATHLRFEVADDVPDWGVLGGFDVATATLVVHGLAEADRGALLRRMALCAPRVLLADYVAPLRGATWLTTHLDELLSGHHRQFRSYQRQGGMPSVLAAAGLHVVEEQEALSGSLRLWVCAPAGQPPRAGRPERGA